jgi:ribosomal protein S14
MQKMKKKLYMDAIDLDKEDKEKRSCVICGRRMAYINKGTCADCKGG